MRNILLIIEYDGSAYCGWQVQPNAPTVQGAVEAAIKALTGETVRIHGSSRTDSGVHARGQAANFLTAFALPGEAFARALNAHLPKDISIRESREVAEGFHARFNSAGKIYQYQIENAPTRPALDRQHVWWVSWKLDLELMRQASAVFVGKHDFTSFAAVGDDADERDPVKELRRLEWRREGTRLTFEIEGSGFLHKMVRCIVGNLVEAGRGRFSPDDLRAIMERRDHSAAGPTAPPQGLCLCRVFLNEKDIKEHCSE